MRLSRLFIRQSLSVGSQVQLDVAASHYVRNVLRLKAGVSIALFNGDILSDFEAELSFEGKQTFATIQKQTSGNKESPLASEIIQGLSRSDHLDWMIQKTTELGVMTLSIFNAQHTQIPIKPAQLEKKLIHWQGIAIKACEQSGRFIPPQILFYKNLNQALAAQTNRETKWLLDFEGERIQSLLQQPTHSNSTLSIMIGPEGGLSSQEIVLAKNSGFISARLGPRVLRTETAAMTALAIAQSLWGDL